MKVLVTGASGFIGSAFIRYVAKNMLNAIRSKEDYFISSLVALIRMSDLKNTQRLTEDSNVNNADTRGYLNLVNVDLLRDISGVCEGVDVVVHFAARTFVDHSIRDASPFIYSNVLGTLNILEDARRHKVKRFYQISTDEVYGAILKGSYKENAPINPTNPYAASKAGADALALSYAHTYGMHITVTRTENNYGPYQHPQKAFPTFIRKSLAKEKLPIYGDGKHVRQWLYVDDHVRALLCLMQKDYASGEVFHVAGNQELENIELAEMILKHTRPDDIFQDCISFIDDYSIRPGHDRRYALDSSKLRTMGWEPSVSLEDGVRFTVDWYKENQWWMR